MLIEVDLEVDFAQLYPFFSHEPDCILCFMLNRYKWAHGTITAYVLMSLEALSFAGVSILS